MSNEASVTEEAATAAHQKGPARPRRKARKTTSKGARPSPRGKARAGSRTSNKEAGRPAADLLGRPGSLGRFIAELVMKGQDNDTVSKAAAKSFPKSASTTPKHVAWARWNLKRRGVKKVPESK